MSDPTDDMFSLMPREIVARAAFNAGCRETTADAIRGGSDDLVKIKASVAIALVGEYQAAALRTDRDRLLSAEFADKFLRLFDPDYSDEDMPYQSMSMVAFTETMSRALKGDNHAE